MTKQTKWPGYQDCPLTSPALPLIRKIKLPALFNNGISTGLGLVNAGTCRENTEPQLQENSNSYALENALILIL